jgi:hypothetical protein
MKVFSRWPLVLLAITVSAASGDEPVPLLWGYGAQTCARFVEAADGVEAGNGDAVNEYRHFQEWLAGFVSAINLATGRDVLQGLPISQAMQQAEASCRANPSGDFFNTAMTLVHASLPAAP